MPNTEVKLLSADGSEGLPFVRVGRRHARCVFIMPKNIINVIIILKNDTGSSSAW